MMKRKKIKIWGTFLIIALAVSFLIQSFSVAYAGTLTVLKDRLNRQKQNQTSGISHLVVFKTALAVSGGDGNNSVILVFPDADDGKWCRTAGTDLVVSGCTEDSANALGGTPALTARCVKGVGASNYDTIYVEQVNNLAATTSYCVQISGGATGKLGTPTNTTTGVITVKTNNGLVDVDTGQLPVDIITNDQVAVQATVPAAPQPPQPPQPPGGGGGGGGGEPATQVIFVGRAYPRSSVSLLRDAQLVATTIAGTDANFQMTLGNISGGNYLFAVYSEDRQGRRFSLLTFFVSVTAGVTTTVSGIFIAPTIDIDKSEVKRGDNIAIFGQSVPQGEITIVVGSGEEFFAKVKADNDGAWLHNFDTVPLDMGQHLTKSKSASQGAITEFSKTVSFLVGTKTVIKQPVGGCPPKADLNNDCKVNLIDFSIAAYWYKRTLSSDFNQTESSFLNGDGKVDLVDFSIMAFYWTG